MIEQFKTITDLSAIIKEFEGMISRPTPRGSYPALYRRRDGSKQD